MECQRWNREEALGVLARDTEGRMSQADEFRKQAAESRKRANEAKTIGEDASRDRRRANGLEQLAANEDWLDGKSKAQG